MNVQPCRWNYILAEENRLDDPLLIAEEGCGSYILSSRDLNMIEHIPNLSMPASMVSRSRGG